MKKLTRTIRRWRCRRRIRTALTADIDALYQAMAILEEARAKIISASIAPCSGDPIWSKLYEAGRHLEHQLEDAVRVRVGDWADL